MDCCSIASVRGEDIPTCTMDALRTIGTTALFQPEGLRDAWTAQDRYVYVTTYLAAVLFALTLLKRKPC